ncbi:transposase family protein [Psychrosphaera haliotis]|nr:transposase family protein [Psychrosphaera haliotis]
MAIKEFIHAGQEYLYQKETEEKVYKIESYNVNYVLLRASNGDILDLTPIEFTELKRQQTLRLVDAKTFQTALTPAEEEKIKLLRAYIEPARHHESGKPSGKAAIEHALAYVQKHHKKIPKRSGKWIQNHITPLKELGYDYRAFVVGKRPEYHWTQDQIAHFQLLELALEKEYFSKQSTTFSMAYREYVELVQSKMGSEVKPRCENTMRDYFEKHVDRERKLARHGQKNLHDKSYANIGIWQTDSPLELVQCDTKTVFLFVRSDEPEENTGQYKVSKIRLCVYAAIDSHTSAVVGLHVHKGYECGNGVINLVRNVMSVRNGKLGGIPSELRFDNGAGFIADNLHHFLTQVHIDWDFAKCAHGQDKPHVESFFRVLTKLFLDSYPGFIPKDPEHKNIDLEKIKKSPLKTESEFEYELGRYITNYNNRDPRELA